MNHETTEATRYARQVRLPEVGQGGQERLRRARVLVVGVGGLGAPAALHLTAAGVGLVGLMDGDTAEVSNLQRQTIYNTASLGRPKAEEAAAALAARNPEVKVRVHPVYLTAARLAETFAGYDFVIDGTDGAEAKFLINDGAVLTSTPFSHAGALGWVGQTMTVIPGRSACFRCVFPSRPEAEELPTCQTAGIVGPVAGAIGLVQATEALKFFLGTGELLTDRLLTYDALAQRWRAIRLRRNRECPLCGQRPTITTIAAAARAA